jgi:hypothetical protein
VITAKKLVSAITDKHGTMEDIAENCVFYAVHAEAV